MRKVVPGFVLLIVMMVLFFLVGCTDDEADLLYEAIVQGVEGQNDVEEADGEITDNGVTESSGAVESDGVAECNEAAESNLVAEGDRVAGDTLSGTLHILTGEWDTHLHLLGRLFREKHPEVELTFERVEMVTDIAQQTALATRLLADPPDIFNTTGLVFEKFSMDALFVELNELLDGPNGINREDYFDNILRGAEINGNLYHIPLMVGTDTVLLNRQLFGDIGVDVAEIDRLTLAQYLDFLSKSGGAP